MVSPDFIDLAKAFNPFFAAAQHNEDTLRPFIDYNESVTRMMQSLTDYNDSVTKMTKPFADYHATLAKMMSLCASAMHTMMTED